MRHTPTMAQAWEALAHTWIRLSRVLGSIPGLLRNGVSTYTCMRARMQMIVFDYMYAITLEGRFGVQNVEWYLCRD